MADDDLVRHLAPTLIRLPLDAVCPHRSASHAGGPQEVSRLEERARALAGDVQRKEALLKETRARLHEAVRRPPGP